MAKRTKKPSMPKTKPEPEVLFLVGRPFVITGGEHMLQGTVRGQVDDLNYLAELASGELVIVEVEQMLTPDPSKPTWHFFETEQQCADWIANLPTAQPTSGVEDEERLAAT